MGLAYPTLLMPAGQGCMLMLHITRPSLVTVAAHARAPGSGAGTGTPGQGIAHGSTPGLGAGTGQSGGAVIAPGCQTRFGKFCLGACSVPSMTGANEHVMRLLSLSSSAVAAAI